MQNMENRAATDMPFYNILKEHGLEHFDILSALLSRNICCVASFIGKGKRALKEIQKQFQVLTPSMTSPEETDRILRENHLLKAVKCTRLQHL